MAFFTLFLTGLVALLSAALLFYSWNFNYWKKRNVPYYNPSALSTLIATRFRSLPLLRPIWLMFDEAYWNFKDQPFVGTFQASRPVLIMRDPELIKLVLTRGFSTFHSRGFPVDEENDPFSANLVSLDGDRWKNLRSKLSPTFTSGKLKLMYPLMEEVMNNLKSILKRSAEEGEEVDMNNLLTRYTTDVVGSCAFGVDCNSLQDPTSEFFLMGRAMIDTNVLVMIRFLLGAISPVLLKLLPFKHLFYQPQRFFTNLMKETVKFREENKVERSDFVSLMMKLRDANTDSMDLKKHKRFGIQQMASEAFLFFSAGVDSTASVIGFCLHAMAFDPELQRRAVEEVQTVVRKHDGVLSYEAVRELDLVERIVQEGLRLYGPAIALLRTVSSPIKIPDSDLVLDKTPMVWIPVFQVHRDPAHFKNPDRFDPDHFTEEAKKARHPYAFLPFGEGPRFCIAERFAMLEMKLSLTSLLKDFHFSPGPRSEAKPELNPKRFAPSPMRGFWLQVEERK